MLVKKGSVKEYKVVMDLHPCSLYLLAKTEEEALEKAKQKLADCKLEDLVYDTHVEVNPHKEDDSCELDIFTTGMFTLENFLDNYYEDDKILDEDLELIRKFMNIEFGDEDEVICFSNKVDGNDVGFFEKYLYSRPAISEEETSDAFYEILCDEGYVIIKAIFSNLEDAYVLRYFFKRDYLKSMNNFFFGEYNTSQN